MMLIIDKVAIRVVHTQKHDKTYDYVPASRLQGLITSHAIIRFFRPEEQQWVEIGVDPVRGTGGRYNGPERRFSRDTIL